MFSTEREEVFGGWLKEEDTSREQWVRIGLGVFIGTAALRMLTHFLKSKRPATSR